VRLSWHREDVDARLHGIMRDIHENCVHYSGQSGGQGTGGKNAGPVNYLDGANIAGFVKVADAMLEQGVY